MAQIIIAPRRRHVHADPLFEDPRSDAVHGDAIAADLFCQAFREALQRRFGGAVMHRCLQHLHAGERADVEDPAATHPDHAAQHALGDEERALHVHVHHLVPVVLLHQRKGHDLAHAGVVDEHVHRRACFGLDGADHGVDRHLVQDRGAKGPRPRARAAKLVEGSARIFVGAAVVERHRRPLAGERPADGAAQPAGAPGHQRHLSLEQSRAHPALTTGSLLPPRPLAPGRAKSATAVSGPFAAPRWNMLNPQAGMTRPSACG